MDVLEQMKETLNPKSLKIASDCTESTCPICHGTGWKILLRNGYEYAAECDCGLRQSQIMESKLKFANIPESYKEVSLKNFDFDVYKDKKERNVAILAGKAIKYWLDNLEDMEKQGKGLFIFSDTKGSGKTRMAASIANELIQERKKLCKFATSMQIINEIKATWSRDDIDEATLLNDLSKAQYLIIDDFGTEVPRDWIGDKFYSIINQRYVERKPTIFTSNCSLDTLKYDERITNRILEMCFQIRFPEESVRKHIAEEMAERTRI